MAPSSALWKLWHGIDYAVNWLGDMAEWLHDMVEGTKDKLVDVMTRKNPWTAWKAWNWAMKRAMNWIYAAWVITPVMWATMFGAWVPLTIASVWLWRDMIGHWSWLLSAITELNGKKALKAAKWLITTPLARAWWFMEATGRFIRTWDFKIAWINWKDMSYDQAWRRNYDAMGNDVVNNDSFWKVAPFARNWRKNAMQPSSNKSKVPLHRRTTA